MVDKNLTYDLINAGLIADKEEGRRLSEMCERLNIGTELIFLKVLERATQKRLSQWFFREQINLDEQVEPPQDAPAA